jgi:hypothetical protein
VSGYELSSDDYNALVDFVESISFYYLMQLGEEDKKKVLPLTIKMLLLQGFDLPTVVSVWNDVIEGKDSMRADAEPEKSPTKLDHQRGKVRVLSDDISYLIMRIEHGSLASIAEHYEVQEEIHELQHILADWDSYIGMEIAKYAAQHAVNNWVSQISMRVGRRTL